MPASVWPIDRLGNDIKKGALVHLRLDDPSILCRVLAVEPAGMISSPSGGDMALQGQLRLVAEVTLQFAPGTQFTGILTVKEPDTAPPAGTTQ